MGCDGGTIPRRDELVRKKKKPERVERDMENVAKWRMCALSQQPLREPIVSCPLGRLYNKEALIEALISKSITQSETAKHIKSLKDLKELKLTVNPAFDATKVEAGGDAYRDYNVAQFICPIVGLEMNGNHRFIFRWTCGCVVSEKAVKEVKSDVCHSCGGAVEENEIVVLNGTQEEIDGYYEALEAKRQSIKAAKKAAKNGQTADETDKPGTSKSVGQGQKRKQPTTNGDSKKAKSTDIQADGTKSQVYKSLFTTSEAAKNQPRAHWVTFNPQYY